MWISDLVPTRTPGVPFCFLRYLKYAILQLSLIFLFRHDFQFPIINTTHHLLPSPHGELAPAIEAILDVYGTEVLVLVSHNGQGV